MVVTVLCAASTVEIFIVCDMNSKLLNCLLSPLPAHMLVSFFCLLC